MESINVVVDDNANISVSSIDEEEHEMLPLVGEVVSNKEGNMSPPENSIANDELDSKEAKTREERSLYKKEG